MIHRLLGPRRPCTRIIVCSTPVSVKQAHLGAHIILWIVAGAALFLCGFGPPRLVDREIGATERLSVGQLRQWAEHQATPQLTAQSYLLYDMSSDKIIYEHDSAVARAPASLTKMMTALLVLEHGNLDALVTVQPEDLPSDMADSSTMGLKAGETISVTDLLWGLLLPSGNDAANVLARQVSGSVANFVAAMNQRSQELGLKETHFANPHGLDADGHVSSAADLLVITRKLWNYPLFRSIVATSNSEKAGHNLVNTNELLTTYDGATGVKTGTTDNAGECLIASIERDGQTVFIVILGSSDRFTDAKTLYDTFRASYSWNMENAQELSVINRIYDGDGKLWFLQPAGVPPTILQDVVGVPQVQSFRHLQLPSSGVLASGDQVGELEWWANGVKIGTQTLVVR